MNVVVLHSTKLFGPTYEKNVVLSKESGYFALTQLFFVYESQATELE